MIINKYKFEDIKILGFDKQLLIEVQEKLKELGYIFYKEHTVEKTWKDSCGFDGMYIITSGSHPDSGNCYAYPLLNPFSANPSWREKVNISAKEFLLKHRFSKGFKVRVNFPTEYELVVEKLSGLGYSVPLNSKLTPQQYPVLFLFVAPYSDIILYGVNEDFYLKSPYNEYVINHTVDFNKVDVTIQKSQPEVIEINGKKYSKSAVEERLQNLPEIKS